MCREHDVEGFETHVIDGADQLLRDGRALAWIVEMNGSAGRYGLDERALHRRMLAYGYRAHHYDGHTRELRPADDSVVGRGNVLYLLDAATAQRRVREAPTFQVGHHRI